jgi:RNA polymerase sigma-70 factor (ECF subfamily)
MGSLPSQPLNEETPTAAASYVRSPSDAQSVAPLGSRLRVASGLAEPVSEQPLPRPAKPSMHPDQDLVKWIEQHTPVMVLFARQMVNNHAAAEDVVQEAFMRFWKHRFTANDPLAYLYQTVRRTALDWIRGERRRSIREQAVAGRTAAADVPAFCSPLEQAEQRRLVEEALKRVPLPQREVLVLRIWGGLRFSQIAEATGLSINTTTSRYRYALENLRKAMDKEAML